MPSKQKSGLYRSKVKIGVDSEGKDVVKWVSGKTAKELEAAKREVEAFYITGTGLQDDRLFGEYAKEWYRVRKAPNVSPSTQQEYRYTINKHIMPKFGSRNLRAIKPTELQDFLNGFSGVSQTKITMIMASLRGIFRAACADRIVANDPTAHLVKPTASAPKEKRPLTHDERARIEAVCASHAQGHYLAVMYYLGVRPGEARGLRWGDIDWTEKTVHIQRDIDFKNKGKAGALKTTSSDRYIPMPETLCTVLKPRRGLTDAYIVTGDVKHGALSKTVAERLWVELMLACKMVVPIPEGESRYRAGDIRSQYAPIVTPHILRHNYITICWEHGIDVYTTMRLAGHKSIKTTMDIYTHLSKPQFDRAAIQIEDMFSKNKVAQKLHKPKKQPS